MGAAGNVLALGLDVVDVERIRTALERTPTLADRVYTPDEISYCRDAGDPAERFAVRWAAKEAVIKTLGGGVPGIDLRGIEVCRTELGVPSVSLSGRAAELADERGYAGWLVSLSHTATIAQAVVAALGHSPGRASE